MLTDDKILERADEFNRRTEGRENAFLYGWYDSESGKEEEDPPLYLSDEEVGCYYDGFEAFDEYHDELESS